MAGASIKYKSFVTPLGQSDYLKMPFGLTDASRVFNKFTQSIFKNLIRENKLLVYLDDLLIATFEEHFCILNDVSYLAQKYNLQFRLDKC